MGRKPITPVDPEKTCRHIDVFQTNRGKEELHRCTNLIKIKGLKLCRRHYREWKVIKLSNSDEFEKFNAEQKLLRRRLRGDTPHDDLNLQPPEDEGPLKYEKKTKKEAAPRESLDSSSGTPREAPPNEESRERGASPDASEDESSAVGSSAGEPEINNKGPNSLDRALFKEVDKIASREESPPPKKAKLRRTPKVTKPQEVRQDEVEVEKQQEESESACESVSGASPESEKEPELEKVGSERGEAVRYIFLAGVLSVVELAEQIISRHTPLNVSGTSLVLATTPGIKDIIFRCAEDIAPQFADPENLTPTKELGMWIALSAFASFKKNQSVAAPHPSPQPAPATTEIKTK